MKDLFYALILGVIVWFAVGAAIADAQSTDLAGNPLPEPWITQESHDAVVNATGLTGVDPSTLPVDHAYNHWLASGGTLVFFGEIIADLQRQVAELQAELDSINNPPPPPAAPVPRGCENAGTFRDGSNGALWKPFSDVTDQPVILYPASLTGKIKRDSCWLLDKDAIRITNCPYRTVANGGREHYNVFRDTASLTPLAPIYVRVELKDGSFDCRVVPQPEERQD